MFPIRMTLSAVGVSMAAVPWFGKTNAFGCHGNAAERAVFCHGYCQLPRRCLQKHHAIHVHPSFDDDDDLHTPKYIFIDTRYIISYTIILVYEYID